jgi:hypothetical protein
VTDFEYEFVMANMNKKLAPQIETMIVFASPQFYYVSSNTVKEVAMNGGNVRDLVPAAVDKALKAKRAQVLAARHAQGDMTTAAVSAATPARGKSARNGLRTQTRKRTRRRTK